MTFFAKILAIQNKMIIIVVHQYGDLLLSTQQMKNYNATTAKHPNNTHLYSLVMNTKVIDAERGITSTGVVGGKVHHNDDVIELNSYIINQVADLNQMIMIKIKDTCPDYVNEEGEFAVDVRLTTPALQINL